MAKTSIRAVPTTLPNIRLYLDDLMEIQEVYSEFYAKIEFALDVSFFYLLDNISRVTTFEELEEHGDPVMQFELGVHVERQAPYPPFETHLLRIWKHGEPTINSSGLSEADCHSVFSRVRTIIDPRRNRIRESLAVLPSVFFVVSGLILSAFFWILEAKHKTLNWLLELSFLLTVFSVAAAYGQTNASRVYLKYFRPNERERLAKRKELTEKVLVGFINAVIGGILGWFLKGASGK